MQHFKMRLAVGLRPDPLGELTGLPDSLTGMLDLGEETRSGWEEKGVKGKVRGRRGKGKWKEEPSCEFLRMVMVLQTFSDKKYSGAYVNSLG